MSKRQPPPLILPKSLDPIGYIIGLSAALKLARAAKPHPCRPDKASLYIPAPDRLEASHPLSRILGRPLALEVCEEMGGSHWWPPSGEHIEAAILARQVLDLVEVGLNQEEIAERCGSTAKWAGNVLTAYELWQETGDLEAVRLGAKVTYSFASLLLNRSW
ncbi:hypothetical protein M8009_02425 [Halomonas sp. ATCH28]|uniref:Uncharacterized protein n=1 Tax=Halomonas gemina TaxID=2945105 RepID=A0ABT0SX48_9GAMM|nr:hypothetical protein [Halomonas gemina]MCL7939162.1 hypothetical protein [Halomonas gemina]